MYGDEEFVYSTKQIVTFDVNLGYSLDVAIFATYDIEKINFIPL